MTQSNSLSAGARLYVSAIIVAGAVVAGSSIWQVVQAGATPTWFVLAFLTLASGSFTVRIPTIPARLSVSETFVFAAVLMFGPAAATVIVLLDTLVISFWLGRRSNPLTRLLFNVTAPATAIWVSSQLFYRVTGIVPLASAEQPILPLVFPIVGLALVYFLLNSWLIALAVAFQRHASAVAIWKHNFLWLSLNYFSGASVAALLLPYLLSTGYVGRIAFIFIPLLLISYLTFRTALGRVDDANRHLEELNRLYLSTIETLAMAIDAKDQITHGHIRRVQRYAVRLATSLGVKDQSQIKAIEAASLLHDMGKLAVPEYILNKPGKLTKAEFERMKTHASIGAEILSSIEFPYPVVPIVRHHHENWDGTGYPDGLRGTEIPVGARILAVVDCFDALTSDRPYRPKLSDAEATTILIERRAKMYDPLIVDTFLKVHSQLADDHHNEQSTAFSAAGTQSPETPASVGSLEHIAASAEESRAFYTLASELGTASNEARGIDVIHHHLRRLLPVQVSTIYRYDQARDEITAVAVAGEGGQHLLGLSMPRGQRLSGWVAANLRTIANSDAVLDLGDLARSMKPRLGNCLATPVSVDRRLFGVLTLYAGEPHGFSEDHRRIVEQVAKQLSSALEAWNDQSQKSFASSNNVANLAPFSFGNGALPALGATDVCAAIVVSSGSGEDGAIDHAGVRECVRNAVTQRDLIIVSTTGEVVALLMRSELGAAELAMQRMIDNIQHLRSDRLTPAVYAGLATSPEDGGSTAVLIEVARARRRPLASLRQRTSVH